MLTVQNLSFRYPGRDMQALRGVSFSLQPGEIAGVLGKNGAGKTTLFHCLLGQLKPQGGQILLHQSPLSAISRRERAKAIAYVPQEVRFGGMSVYDSVLMGRIASFGLRRSEEDHAAVERVLRDMGLEVLASRNAEELSGGEKKKIAIARALAQEPRMLLLDEPTASLDMANEQMILREVKRLAAQQGIAVLAALHDLNQALWLCTRLVLIREGQVAYDVKKKDLTPRMIRDVFGVDVQLLKLQGTTYVIGGGTP